MDTLKHFLAPLTDRLPPRVHAFLDAGGWWLLGGVVGLIVLVVAWSLAEHLFRALFGRRPAPPDSSAEDLLEDLADYPAPAPVPGGRRLTIYHLPARLRLVVLAPIGTEARIDPTTPAGVWLDPIVPGLGEIAVREQASLRVWPPQLSQHGFTATFRRRTQRPEPEGEPSHWVLVSGRAQAGRRAVLVGLALWTDEPTVLGRVALEPHQWLDVLRIKTGEG